MKTVVFTSDNHSWLLGGFFHQWKKYGRGLKVEVAGFENPGFLPADVNFVSIGEMKDYPVDLWSNAIFEYLNRIDDELVLILLEDYWLLRPINIEAVKNAEMFMEKYKNVARLDLTTDRALSREAVYAGTFGNLDLCSAKGEYALSFQASIYRRSILMDLLRPNESPWESELNGTDRLNHSHFDVYGTYQWPIAYMIVMNKGRFDRDGLWMRPARTLTESDWQELEFYLFRE